MQPTQPPEDDGLTVMQRLTPDQFDVVLGSHPGKRKAPPTKSSLSLSSLVIGLAVLTTVFYLGARLFRTPKPVLPPVATTQLEDVSVEPATATTNTTATTAPDAPIRTTEQVVYVAPKLETAPPIDNPPPRPQGMVSERYMAQYKSTAAAQAKPDAGRRYEVAGVLIREIDGRNRYEARYRVFNNHIETSSVCFNFKPDTAEYRECRRAAEPYFKDMCSDWNKRVAKDKDEKNKLAQEQYCDAASTYRP